MSTTELYTITKSGRVKYFTEYKNSHFGAASIWNLISNEYFNCNYYEINDLHEPSSKFWKLIYKDNLNNSEIQDFKKIVFVSTFDKTIIMKNEFEIFIDALIKFKKNYFYNIEKERINTKFDGLYYRIDEYIKDIKFLLNKKNIIGICFNQTNINSDQWEIQELNHTRMYNIYKDEEHYTLLENLI
jgi:hypothetical protein